MFTTREEHLNSAKCDKLQFLYQILCVPCMQWQNIYSWFVLERGAFNLTINENAIAGLEQFIFKGNNLLGLYNRQLTGMST